MKLRIEKSALQDAVSWAARMLPAKAPIPVLSGIMLTAENDGVLTGGTLSLGVFDYEVSGRCQANAEVMEPGQVLVSGRMLAEIVKSLPAKPVEMVTDGSKVRITCGSSKFTLLTMPMDDYPTLPTMPAGAGVIPGDVFASAVMQVAVAASKEATPPMLAGVRVEIDGDQMTMMATDRYRLAAKTFPWKPSDPDVTAGALVKAFTLSEVAKTLAQGSDVTVGLSGELIGFESNTRRSTSLLMDAQYPNVMSLFPTESTGHAVVNVAALVDAVKRVGLVAERNTAIKVTFADGQVSLEGGQGEDAQASESVEAVVTGAGVVQGFNPAFLLDGLTALPQQYVRFTYTASGKPVVLTGQVDEDGTDEQAYRYLLMPMRI